MRTDRGWSMNDYCNRWSSFTKIYLLHKYNSIMSGPAIGQPASGAMDC